MRLSKATLAAKAFLSQALAPETPVLILMHDNPDPDCLSAGWALKTLFDTVYRAPATLAYSGIIGRVENRAMVELLKLPLLRLRETKPEQFPFWVLVDAQPGAGNISLKSERPFDFVLDHHPRRKGQYSARYVDVRPRVGASATLAYEYLLTHGLTPDKDLATALLYAIKSETQDLGREAGALDRRVLFALYPRADHKRLFAITHAQVPREYFRVVARTLDNARLLGETVVSFLGEIGAPEYPAEMADMLLRLNGTRVCLVGGWFNGTLYLSIRTLHGEKNAGLLMQQIVAGLGSGGGHESMAGGRIEQPSKHLNRFEIEESLTGHFLKALKLHGRAKELLPLNR